MPAIGLEPIRLLRLRILSPVRLPIPPRGHLYEVVFRRRKILVARFSAFTKNTLFFASNGAVNDVRHHHSVIIFDDLPADLHTVALCDAAGGEIVFADDAVYLV